jgi:hypothetical protein
MDEALNTYFVPELRKRGFKGSLPHFRRLRSDQIDLLSVQFDRNGGGFVLEICRCGVEGVTSYWGKQVPASKVTSWDLHPDKRQRLQLRDGSGTDSWFRFESGAYDEVARQVLSRLSDADQYWGVRA